MFRSMQTSLSHEDDYKTVPASSYDGEDLKDMVGNAVRDSMGQNTQHPGDDCETGGPDQSQEFGSYAYEDILATAVLNKVLEKCDTSQDFGEGMSLEQGGGTDTDSGLSGSIRGGALKRIDKNISEGASEESSSPLCESPKDSYAMTSKIRDSPTMMSADSPDIGVGLDGSPFENSSDIVWNFGNDAFSPLQFKIEEHIEEVTTHRLTDEESNSSYAESENDSAPDGANQRITKVSKPRDQPRKTFRKSHFASKIFTEEAPQVLTPFDLPSLSADDIERPRRVPFPELGVDLLQDSSTTIGGGPSELLLENSDWKENWLFRKEKSRDTQIIQMADSITMLIPNPSLIVNPTIGDRDIDELSELSDRHSVYSLDTSSDDDDSISNMPTEASKDLLDLVGEINAEFGQQDHEYTEDISALDRLQMTNTYSRNLNGVIGNFITGNGEMTGVTPVTKSGSRTSAIEYKTSGTKGQPKRGIDLRTEHARNKKHADFSKILKPNIVPKPPTVVPHVLDRTLTTSPSVWFESVPEAVVVPLGRILRLSCQVHSRQICGVSWYFENELLVSRDDVLIWKRGDTYHLNIFGMSEVKSGSYVVGAYTKDNCVWSKCTVTCVDQGRAAKIPRITLALSDVTVERGSDAIIECQVGGHPEPRVTFMKNSIPLNPSSGQCFTENDQYGTWTLGFHEVKDTDAGQIKVIASNSLGHAMSFCNLKVVGEDQVKVSKTNEGFCSNLNESNIEAARNVKNKKNSSSEFNNSRSKNNRTTKTIINNDFNKSNYDTDPAIISSSEYFSTTSVNASEYYNGSSHDDIDYGNNNNITINGCMFQPPKPEPSKNLFPFIRPSRQEVGYTNTLQLTSLPPIPGTIAEREHRKWLEAKPMANNPYAPEKLVDRLGKSPHRFPSLPTVYRDTSGDECTDPSLRDCLLSSYSDLSRYSRDYHINEDKEAMKNRSQRFNDANRKLDVRTAVPRKSNSLVKIESKISDNWKEELKDIKLNVGKKVADIQKTIDAYQYEWQKRLQQRGWNPTASRCNGTKRNSQKLSASCINLHTPPATKSYASGSRNRHLVYSSTETLNRDQSQNNLWRTVSVDTLNPPFKYTFPTTEPSQNQRYDRKEVKENVERRYSCPPLSDSDDSSNMNTPFYHSKQMETNSYQNGYASNGYPSNRRIASYYSENSIESLKEESDTEDSLPMSGDNSNKPSVKELANKFDSLKNVKNRTAVTKRHHEKLRTTRNKDIVIVDQNDHSNLTETEPHNFIGRKYNDRYIVNEVRIGGKPTKIYASNYNKNYPRSPYRFEGFKERPTFSRSKVISDIYSPSSEVFTPTEKNNIQFSFDNVQYSSKYRNRFSTSEMAKADDFWGNGGSNSLHKMRNLSASNSSMTESELSIATLPIIPDSTSKDINELFGIKLRRGTSAEALDTIDTKHIHKSSSSDIFPLSKSSRPKSLHDLRFLDLSDEENSDSASFCDPVIARKHNLPKFYANVTTRPLNLHTTNSESLHDISNNDFEPYSERKYNTISSGAFSLDRKTGNKMYDFLKKYENKKSLEEIHQYSSKKPELAVVEEAQVSSSISESTAVKESATEGREIENMDNFNIPFRPKVKKRGSMHDFLKMYTNKTSLSVIPNSEEKEESTEEILIAKEAEPVYNAQDQSTSHKNYNEVAEHITREKAEMKIEMSTVEAITETVDKENTAEPIIGKAENKIVKVDQSAAQMTSSSMTTVNQNQISTLYASVNKPSIKPKPESLKNLKISSTGVISPMQPIKRDAIPKSPKLSYEKNHQPTKISKYHITPNYVYSQYLHNYSNMRSLKEKSYSKSADNLYSETLKSKEMKPQTLRNQEVQTEPERKEGSVLSDEKFSNSEKNITQKFSHTNDQKYKNIQNNNDVFRHGANVTIKIDVQPINRRVENESTQTTYEMDIVAEGNENNVTASRHFQSIDVQIIKENSYKDENKEKDFQEKATKVRESVTLNDTVDKKTGATVVHTSQSTAEPEHTQKKFVETQNKSAKKTSISSEKNDVELKVDEKGDEVDSLNNVQNHSHEEAKPLADTTIFAQPTYEYARQHSYELHESSKGNTAIYRRQTSKPLLLDVDDDSDPLSLTKRIVKGARYSSSGLVGASPKYDMSKASLPEHSPFIYKPRKF